MESAVKASGMASSTSCCSRRRSKVSRAAPTPNGASSPRTKPIGDSDTAVRAMPQTPLDSSKHARRASSSSITRPARCTGTSAAQERAIFFSRSFSTNSRGSFSATNSSAWLTSSAGARAAHEAPPRTPPRQKVLSNPLDEGHNDLHSSTSSCVSVPERRPSAINGARDRASRRAWRHRTSRSAQAPRRLMCRVAPPNRRTRNACRPHGARTSRCRRAHAICSSISSLGRSMP